MKGIKDNMIPKIIHYCWFGGKPKPDVVQAYIDSWRRFCPDYEIREWNESNFNINENAYCREAYEAKKWAFVSDYARVKVLYNHGGIYIDTDVEFVRSFDSLLDDKIVMGFENNHMVSTGTIGSEVHNEFLSEILQEYSKRHFVNPDGSLDMMTNVQLITELLTRNHGLTANGKEQILHSGIHILPMESFVAKDYWTGWILADETTYAIHHYASTWVNEEDRKLIAKERYYIRQIYKKIETPVHKIAAFKAVLELSGVKGILKKVFH